MSSPRPSFTENALLITSVPPLATTTSSTVTFAAIVTVLRIVIVLSAAVGAVIASVQVAPSGDDSQVLASLQLPSCLLRYCGTEFITMLSDVPLTELPSVAVMVVVSIVLSVALTVNVPLVSVWGLMSNDTLPEPLLKLTEVELSVVTILL